MKRISSAEKLQLLQNYDRFRSWRSLDEKRSCVLCEQIFDGNDVRIVCDRSGELGLHCPTRNCRGTPAEWVRTGNPLLCEDAWSDWLRLIEDVPEEIQQVKPVRRSNRQDSAAHFAD